MVASADAEQDREYHHREHVAVGHRLDRVRGHEIDQEVDAAAARGRGRGQLRAVAEPLEQRGVEPDAGLEQVDEAHADRDRDRRDRRGVGERAQADPPDAPQIAELRDRERERRHHERDHEHEQEPQEDLARGLDA